MSKFSFQNWQVTCNLPEAYLYHQSATMQPSSNLLLYDLQPTVDYSLYDPQLTRALVAKELGICQRTLYEYMTWGAELVPYLHKYLNEFHGLNRRKIDSVDLQYLEEITDLRRRYTKDRATQILQAKYKEFI